MKDDRFPPELQGLFDAYRDACTDGDASAAFMPGLWARIEQRQRVTYSFRQMASGFVTVAAAICLIISAAMWSPSAVSGAFSSATYVDVLAEDGAVVSEFEQADSL